jgi:hypothetical protein
VKSLIKTDVLHQIRCALSSTANVIVWLGCLSYFLLTSNSAVASQTPAPQSLETLYRQGLFSDALASCQQTLSKNPNNLNLRYWRANIWVNLNNLAYAKLEYQYVFANSNDSKLKEYCRLALEKLTLAYPNTSSSVLPAASAVNPSADRITRQADADSNGILMDGTVRQNYFRNRGAQEAGLAGDMISVDAMQRATIRVGNTYVPRYTADEIQFQRNQVTDRANQLRTENEARGAEALQVAQQKVFETQASAANLAAQINSGSKNGFHLKEEGTSLYVRQYNAPPSNSSSPNPATVMINDSADAQRGRFDSPMQATARALDPVLQKQLDIESRKTVKSNVFGRINPPEQTSDHLQTR